MSLPLGLSLYRATLGLVGPFAPVLIKKRVRAGKEDPQRLGERFGEAGLPRPEGPLVWIHGASVGESLVSLTLANALTSMRPDLTVLLTSGTRTSASLIAARLHPGILHQYLPADRLSWVQRFLDHWTPDLAVFVESELWPNLLLETARAGTPMALVNARMNERSLKRWARWPQSAAWLFGCFDWIGAADARTAAGLSDLSGRPVARVGNLKLDAVHLPPEPQALAEARAQLGTRPVWVAASTHTGEDGLILEAHRRLLADHPDALLILAPRHPERADEIAHLLTAARLVHARRSAGELAGPQTQVWLADTLGEMPLWFTLAPVALIAGSLREGIGGHNPLEATRCGASVITGPHTASFDDVFAAYRAVGAVQTVDTPGTLADAVRAVWSGTAPSAEAGLAAVDELAGDALSATLTALTPLLPEAEDA